MRSVKFFLNCVLFNLCIVISIVASARTLTESCGTFIINVKMINEKKIYERQFFIYLKKELIHRSEIGYGIKIACVKSKKGRYVMLFNEFCSGNACPEHVYGLFDLKAKKMLFMPNENSNENVVQIEKILGYTPLNIGEKDFFCCTTKFI